MRPSSLTDWGATERAETDPELVVYSILAVADGFAAGRADDHLQMGSHGDPGRRQGRTHKPPAADASATGGSFRVCAFRRTTSSRP